MSKFEECKTNMNNKKYLVQALQAMGYEPEVHTKPAALVGYMADEREELAHVIVRRKQIGRVSNDLGFRKENGTFQAIISDFDSRRFNQAWLGKLSQTYKEKQTMAVAKQKGYIFQGRTEVKGKVQLKFSTR